MRPINIKTLYQKKFKVFDFDFPTTNNQEPTTLSWSSVLGTPEKGGIWLIYGNEKNGKTTFALKIAELLSLQEKVLYISGEEGTRKSFQDTCIRVHFNPQSKVLFSEYLEIPELKEKLAKRQGPKICILDNITVYIDELKHGELRKLQREFPQVLFIFLAHEENNEPYTATAKLCKKLSDIIIRVVGMTAIISGRCPGGTLVFNEEKAMLYHGK